MKLINKKIVLIAVIMFAAGIVLTILGSLLGGRPGFVITRSGIEAGYNQAKASSLEKTKLDSFENISLDVDYADVKIIPSDDNSCYLEYVLEGEYNTPLYKISNNTLTVSNRGERFNFINFGFFNNFWSDGDFTVPDYYVKLYLPKDFPIKDLSLYSDTGNITLENVTAASADLSLNYGNLELESSTLNTLLVSMDTGEFKTKNSTAGDVTINVNYGELELQNFSGKNVEMNLDTSQVYLDAAKLENLDYQNDYGELTLLLPDDISTYRFDVATEYGHIRLPQEVPVGFYSEDDTEQYKTEGKGNKKINVRTDTGDITIEERSKSNIPQ